MTEVLLRDAAAHVVEMQVLENFEDFLSHNELGLALRELAAIGLEYPVPADYWHKLKKAAEVMGLSDERGIFRRKYQEARMTRSTA